MKDRIRYIAMAAVAIMVLLFVAFNFDAEEVNVIVGKVRMPRAFVVLGSFMAGAGMMWLWAVLRPKLRKNDFEKYGG